MSIAAFVDPPDRKQDLAIELAIALAEFCIQEHENLYLLSDVTTALEIGISLLGSRESRVIEGGEYRPSPLVLLPFIPRPNSADDRALREGREDESGGGIEELFALGLFARPREREAEFDPGGDPAIALRNVIAWAHPQQIVGLAEASRYWEAIEEGIGRAARVYNPRLVVFEGFEVDRRISGLERTVVSRPEGWSVERAEDERIRDEELWGAQRQAESDGALVAGFYRHLLGEIDRR